MKNYFYADSSDNPQGPFAYAQLKELAASGTILADTKVCSEGDAAWATWADVENVERQAEMVQHLADGADQIRRVITGIAWGALLLALLLILLQFFTMPWSLLRKAAHDLTEWGRRRMLPSARSELPVLTFLMVVLRPAVHLVCTLAFLLVGLFTLFHRSGFMGMERGLTERIFSCLGIWLLGYFSNVVIGFFFDSISVFVQMANSLKKLEPK
jgi:hypothetical protein